MRDRLPCSPRRFVCVAAALVAFAVGSPTRAAAQEPSPPAEPTSRQGLVLDDQGRPLEGARISVVDRAAWTVDDLEQRVVATTDADGRFRFPADALQPLPVGDPAARTLAFHRPGRATVLLPLPSAGQELPPVILRLGRTLLARVINSEGQPLAGVRVAAEQLVPSARLGMVPQPGVAARTDAKGIAKLIGAPLHGVELQVREAGYVWARTLPGAFDEIVELRSARIGGIVGQVVGSDGEPLAEPGLSIEIVDDAGTEQRVVTDAEGRFRGERWSRLRHRVRWRGERDGQSGALASGPVVAVGPNDAEPIRVVVEREADAGEAAEAGSGAARVLVVDDASGEPVAGARFFQAGRVPGLVEAVVALGAGENMEIGVSDERGIVELADIPPARAAPGESPFLVLAPGREPWSGEPSALPETDGGPRRYEVRLRPGAQVRGVVRAAGSGEPLAGVQVALLPKARPMGGGFDITRAHWRAVSDDAGRFAIGGLNAGAWELRAVADGRPLLEGLTVTASMEPAAEAVAVAMPDGARLVGTLEGLDALPSGVRVQVRERSDRRTQVIRDARQVRFGADVGQAPDADGRFVVEGLAEGAHLVELLVPGLNLGEGWVPIELGGVDVEGREMERSFDATRAVAGVVTGRLRLPEGLDVPRGRLAVAARESAAPGRAGAVRLAIANAGPGPWAYLDRDGAFTLRLKPGGWSLAVMDVFARSELELEQRLDIAPGSEHRIDTELALGAVRLTLREQPGRPGAFGAGLAFATAGRGNPARGVGGVVMLNAAGVVGPGVGRIELAGLPAEFTVLLPCWPHELRLWEARMAAGVEAQVVPFAGGGGPDADAKREIQPRVGEVLEVEFGLGAGK